MSAEIRQEIDQKKKWVDANRFDFTVGELTNLVRSRELILQPDFQRRFRWGVDKRSQLIESLLIGFPIPPVYFFQNEDGVLEVVDGQQRLSTLIQFIDHKLLIDETDAPADRWQDWIELLNDVEEINADKDQNAIELNDAEEPQPLTLSSCDLVESLNGMKFADFETSLQLEFRRRTINAIVINRGNSADLKYEMFKRLNTGGEPATSQEVRNASLRVIGDKGLDLLQFLKRCASRRSFLLSTVGMADAVAIRFGRRELVLRFFAALESIDSFRGSVTDWLDDFAEKVAKDAIPFDFDAKFEEFSKLFDLIYEKLKFNAFNKFDADGNSVGGLAPAYFEAVALGIYPIMDKFADYTSKEAEAILIELVRSKAFRDVTGPGANSKEKLRKRIQLVTKAYE